MKKPLSVREQWARKTPRKRDAWIAEVLYGWSLVKSPAYGDGTYEGNPSGKRNRLGNLSGISLSNVPRFTNQAGEEHWIPLLEEALGDDGSQE